VGELVAFNLLAGRAVQPVLRLAQLWQAFLQVGVSLRRLGDILSAIPEPQHRPGRASLARLSGRIGFEQVSFRYRPERGDALSDLTFEVQPGQVIGICGASGSGKSTVIKLIQRLHVPSHGRVLVDGQDSAALDPAWLRQHIGVVPQETRLFQRTIRENIALRDPGLPFEQVQRAAELAGAHAMILGLPEGYDTPIGEQGAALSGGQRQRIALARALATDPRILILDEATSALDYESESVIHANMRAITRNRTVFVVAHRASALCAADILFVLDRGRLVEAGAPAVLLRRDGHFAQLHRHQTAGGS
jgi:subfamily B ATP-binding cassette protein HlyB/CyaB